MSERARLITIVTAFVCICLGAWLWQSRSGPGNVVPPETSELEPLAEAVADAPTIAPSVQPASEPETSKRTARGLFGQVTDEAGTPLANVQVTLTNATLEKTNRTTNATGAYSFPVKGYKKYTLEFEAAGHVPQRRFNLKPGNKPVDIQMPRTAYLEGNVVTAAGRYPISDFSLLFQNNNGLPRVKRENFKQHRDSKGAFKIDGIHPNSHGTLWARAPGYAEMEIPLQTPNAGTTGSGLIVQMELGNTLRGRVMNEEQMPIAEAWIFRGFVPTSPEERLEADKFVSDARGVFQITDLGIGDHQISAYKEGYQYDRNSIEIVSGDNETVFTLIEGGTLTGTVTLEGVPVEEARVECVIQSTRQDGEGYTVRGKTDAQGEFNLAGVAGGTGIVSITFSKAGQQRNKTKPVLMQVGLTTHVRFDFARPQSSLEGFLMLTEAKTTSGKIRLLIDSDGVLERRTVNVRSDGYYLVENLPPGYVHLKAFGPRIKGERSVQGELLPGERLQIDMLLYTGAKLFCQLEDIPEDADLVVMVFSESTEVPATINIDEYEELSDTAVAVAYVSGESVEVEGLDPGTYAITVIAVPSDSDSNLSNMQTSTHIVTVTEEPEQEIELFF
jgi:hypothetical protein